MGAWHGLPLALIRENLRFLRTKYWTVCRLVYEVSNIEKQI